MPTYVYHCSACDRRYEIFQRITENALTDCPEGHTATMKRVIQPIAVMFKGEGFHINDYAPKTSESKTSESRPVEAQTATPAGAETPATTAPAPAAPAAAAPAESA